MLIDSFLFHNETELVELRIKYLDKMVDYFVIVEANITHQGKKKVWNFPKILESNLKEFSEKIQYHQLDINPEKIKNEESWIIDDIKGDDAWRIENFQRNYIKTVCEKFSNEDILIISDVDEIPSKQKLEFIKTCDFNKIAPVVFEQHLFHIDCNFLSLESWRGSIATTIQLCKAFSPHKFRRARNRMSHFTDSGWSFSSFGGPNKVKEKLESIAHKEFNNDKYKSADHIMNCQKTGADLFHRNIQKKKVEKFFFPKDLLELMEQNPNFYFGFNS